MKLKLTTPACALCIFAPYGVAGTYSVQFIGGLHTDGNYDRSEFGVVRDWDETNPLAPILKLAADSNHLSTQFEGSYLYLLIWAPGDPGETPPEASPLVGFQTDAQLWGTAAGASAGVNDFNGNTLLNTLLNNTTWQPIGTTYFQVDDELALCSDGKYRASFSVDTNPIYCGGSNGGYGHARLRYTFTTIS